MLIKTADDQSELLRALEERMNTGSDVQAKRARDEFYIRKAGVKGEEQSAYLIDFEYAKSPNWAVIHDLRLEHGGRTAQIDHVLINRWMDVYVLETKYFSSGMKVTEEGEFLRYDSYKRTYVGMSSPLEQNDRHIQVLKDVLDTIDLPTRLGIRIAPNFQSFVLVAPEARVIRPERFDTSRIIKADQLKKSLWRDFESENPLFGILKTAAKLVSGETVELVARQLAAKHVPLVRGRYQVAEAVPETSVSISSSAPVATFGVTRNEPSPASTRTFEPKADVTHAESGEGVPPGPACKSCSSSAGTILYGKYGYYFKCDGCATNTAIRLQCAVGHAPRLRKDGLRFLRECAQCRTSILFYSNPVGK
jgi:hypothetical protein